MTTDDLARLRTLAEHAQTVGDPTWPTVELERAIRNPQTVLALLDAAALGLAWNRVEAALPERALGPWLSPANDMRGWHVAAWLREGAKGIEAYGPTPTAALAALAEKLEGREP